jgi:hypothetical protein
MTPPMSACEVGSWIGSQILILFHAGTRMLASKQPSNIKRIVLCCDAMVELN